MWWRIFGTTYIHLLIWYRLTVYLLLGVLPGPQIYRALRVKWRDPATINLPLADHTCRLILILLPSIGLRMRLILPPTHRVDLLVWSWQSTLRWIQEDQTPGTWVPLLRDTMAVDPVLTPTFPRPRVMRTFRLMGHPEGSPNPPIWENPKAEALEATITPRALQWVKPIIRTTPVQQRQRNMNAAIVGRGFFDLALWRYYASQYFLQWSKLLIVTACRSI